MSPSQASGAIRLPSRVFTTLQTGDGTTAFAPVDHDDSLHAESHETHVGQVRCLCTAGARGLVAIGDTEGCWSIWKEAKGKWIQTATCRGYSSPVIGLQWIFPSAQSPHVSLCSLHEDGRLQNATAEGLRLWSRVLRKRCTRFCAAVNGGGFVVATEDGELLVYDARGVYGRKLPLKAEISQHEVVTEEAECVVLRNAFLLSELVLTDLDWQPGSWGVRPLLVAFSTGHAFLLNIDKAVPVLTVDSRLTSCVAAKWSPSGALAALLGVPVLRFRDSLVFNGEPAPCVYSPQKSTSLHQPGVSLRLVQPSGEIHASVNFSSEDPQTLAWAQSGQQIAAVTNNKVSLILVRQKEVFASSDKGNFIVGTLIPEPLVTQVCFWKRKTCSRSIRAFRGPRLLACCDDLCAVVPYATAALTPNFPWNSETFSFEQRQQSHQQHQGPYLLPEDDDPRKFLVCESNRHRRQSCCGFPVELCDAAGNTLDTLVSPLRPRHAVLLPHCLVISDGSQQLWICWLKPDTQVAMKTLASVIDLTTLSGIPSGGGEVTAIGGRGCCLVVARLQSGSESSCMVPEERNEAASEQLHLIDFTSLCVRALCAKSLFNVTAGSAVSEQPRIIKYNAEPLLQMRQLLDLRQKSPEGKDRRQRILYQAAGTEEPCILQQATELAARFNHTTLWKLLADTALAIEQLDITEEAFLRLSMYVYHMDFVESQVLKRVRSLRAQGEAMPAMAALAGDILGAGAFYEAQQKHTNAASLFLAFGYWKEAADTLLVASASQRLRNSVSMSEVCESLAEAYGEMGEWQLAIDLYKRLPPQNGILDALFYSENYEELESVGREVADGEMTPLLLHAAQLLAAAGRGQIAAACFLKAGKPHAATQAAWRGGEWQEAMCMAREHCGALKLQEIAIAYRGALQHRQDAPNAVQVVEAFMKLGVSEPAAQELKLLTDHLDPAIQNPLQQRKAHIIAALLARHNRVLDAISAKEELTSASCVDETQRNSFLRLGQSEQSEREGECAISLSQEEEKCWRSASASHLYLLCCYYLSQRKARFALCAAMRLRNCYSKEIRIHIRSRLLCISACMAKEWELCSIALQELETDAEASASERKTIEAIGVTVRANRQIAKPTEIHTQLKCSKCNASSAFWECFCPSCDVAFSWCAATGLPIRYVLFMRGQSKTTEAVKETIKAFCGDGLGYTAKDDNQAGVDCEETWPQGGPESPLTCGVCGLSTAAWGPEGPIEDCPLCTQPFSRTTKKLVTFQETQLSWREDRVAPYLFTLRPEEILSQIENMDELVRQIG
ncbi:hypothetical protein Emed_001780 [Eimeria media]